MSLERLPEIKDTVTHIQELFKQQMSTRQLKKYEAALYLARTQEIGIALLESIQEELKLTTVAHEVNTLKNKFDACNSLQKELLDLKSPDYEMGFPHIIAMKGVIKDKTDKTALAVLEKYSATETKVKAESKTAVKKEIKKKVESASSENDFAFVKNNVLGINKTQARKLITLLRTLEEDAA